MPFQKGKSGNPAGRKKGVANHATIDIRASILRALDLEGGVKYLRKLASEEPRAFAALLARVIPAHVKAEVSILDQLSDAEQRGLAASLAALASNESDVAGGPDPTHH